jgi:dTDP-4-dehydrorhamnose reductase
MDHWRRAGVPVVGTTRRQEALDESHVYLDLSEDVTEWRCPWPVSVVVLCAAETKLDACRRDPVGTARVNVEAVSVLVKNLVAQGAFVIYLSSNRVFDGSVPHCKPDAPISPVTEYGRQKAETERLISQWGVSVAIVRFTKILGAATPLFCAWGRALKNGDRIHPPSDIYMSPVPLTCAVSVLRLVGDLRLPGILQVSGSCDVSYADAARFGARLLKADSSLVQPVEVSTSGSLLEPEPAYTALNIDRLKATLGIVPPDVEWTIEKTFMHSRGATE